MESNMENIRTWAIPYFQMSQQWVAPYVDSALVWASYLWEETKIAAHHLQQNQLFMAVLAVWMIVGTVNLILLVDQALFPAKDAEQRMPTQWRFRPESPERRITRSMDKSALYKEASTPAVRRRREMIITPLG